MGFLASCDDSAVSDEDNLGAYSARACNADLLMEDTISYVQQDTGPVYAASCPLYFAIFVRC